MIIYLFSIDFKNEQITLYHKLHYHKMADYVCILHILYYVYPRGFMLGKCISTVLPPTHQQGYSYWLSRSKARLRCSAVTLVNCIKLERVPDIIVVYLSMRRLSFITYKMESEVPKTASLKLTVARLVLFWLV